VIHLLAIGQGNCGPANSVWSPCFGRIFFQGGIENETGNLVIYFTRLDKCHDYVVTKTVHIVTALEVDEVNIKAVDLFHEFIVSFLTFKEVLIDQIMPSDGCVIQNLIFEYGIVYHHVVLEKVAPTVHEYHNRVFVEVKIRQGLIEVIQVFDKRFGVFVCKTFIPLH
jgi:hypothetical protein